MPDEIISSTDNARTQMGISIFGLGYVGSVMAGCLASLGHRVAGVDVNQAKVDLINRGRSPIVEPLMEQLVQEQFQAGRLHATMDPEAAIRESQVTFICVGTPSLRNGKLNLNSTEIACEQLGRALAVKSELHLVAVRSTVLPGTIDEVLVPALERTSGKRAGVDFHVCSNPEFIREGSAINDFFHPPFTLLGADDKRCLAPLRAIYEPISGHILETSLRSAEMVKYACNAFHALKIDFSNEIGSVCQALGVDAGEVMEIVCADTKLNISTAYMKPGFAFGGSCLPKDVKALTYRAKQMDVNVPLLQAIVPSNHAQIDQVVEMLIESGARQIGFLGLSFKPGTDDLRDSPILSVVKRLIGDGCRVRIYDPNVSQSVVQGANRQFAELEVPHIFALLSGNPDEVIEHSELIVVGHRDPLYLRLAESVHGKRRVIHLTEWHSQKLPLAATSSLPLAA